MSIAEEIKQLIDHALPDPDQCERGSKYCRNKPLYILIQEEPDADGVRGYMTVCEDCLKDFLEEYGDPVTFWRRWDPATGRPVE